MSSHLNKSYKVKIDFGRLIIGSSLIILGICLIIGAALLLGTPIPLLAGLLA